MGGSSEGRAVMDVRMPDGTIVKNVPEGVTQEELLTLLGRQPEPQAPEPVQPEEPVQTEPAAPVEDKEGAFAGFIREASSLSLPGMVSSLVKSYRDGGIDRVIEDQLGRTRSGIGQGLLRGFGDEIEAAITSPFVDESYSEVLGNIRDDIRAYSERRPGAAFTSEVVGGGPGFVLNQTRRGMAKVGSELLESAVDAGVTGFGKGEGGLLERSKQAMSDAIDGVAFRAGLMLPGASIRRAARRDIAEPLAGRPINLVADPSSKLGGMYDTLGRTYIGRRMLQAQSEPFIRQADDELAEAVEEAASAKRMAAKQRPRSLAKTRKAAEAVEGTKLRDELVERSIPDAMRRDSPEIAEAIEAADPEGQLELLDAWWGSDGYKNIKDVAYQIDDEGMDALARNISDSVSDPALAGRAGESRVREMLEEIYDEDLGAISGHDLMTFRNKNFAMKANAITGGGDRQLTRTALSKVRSEIDKFMKPQLEDIGLAGELEDMGNRYRHLDALRATQVKANKAGRPSYVLPREVVGTGIDADIRRGRSPLYSEAQEATQRINREVDAAEHAREFVEKQPAVAAAQARLTKAKEAAQRMSHLAPPEVASGWHQTAQTASLGAPAATVLRGVGASGRAANSLVLGGLKSTYLAMPIVQRFKAGQMRWQEAVQEIQRNTGLSERNAILLLQRSTTRATVGGE